MSTMIVDLSNYRDKVGSRIEPGTYTAAVDYADPTKSKAGNPMIVVGLRIVGGEFDGATVVDRLTLSENAMFRAVNFMQAIGMPTPRKRLQVNLAKWIGRKVTVTVHDGDPYMGRVKSEVTEYAVKAKAKDDEDDEDLAGHDDLEDLEQEEPATTAEADDLNLDTLDL